MRTIENLFDLIGQQFEGMSLKVFMLFAVVGMLGVGIAITLYERSSGKKVDATKKAGYFFLVLYLSFLFQITYYRREPGSRSGITTSLKDIFSFGHDVGQMIYRFLNIVLFVPFGAILTGLLKEISGWRRVVVIISFSYLTSLVIEITQLLTQRGYFEVSDLLMNVLGGLLGCSIASVLIRVRKR